jgi:tight adherence protein B
MAGGLQAGLSLPQAVDTVVREGHEPMAGELRRALIEQRLGVEITDALEGVSERMESEDFAWVVMAIRIQREVGGNLAEVLHTVAETIREREYLRRQVRALSAEGRLSGYILTALPPLIAIYMYFVNRAYMEVLYTTVAGVILLVAAGVLLAIGTFAMSKLAKVEV